jgi:ribokinase
VGDEGRASSSGGRREDLLNLIVAFLVKSELASTTLSMTKRKSTAMSDAPEGGAAVVVVGSANVDLVMTPRDLPSPGVTVLAPTYRLLPGGKGANQAYACAKLGHPRVKFVGATGDDDFANIVLRNLEAVGVDCGGVAKRADAPTACASVIVDAKGENQICVGSGANATVTASQLDGLITKGDVLLMQMEVPPATLCECVAKAKAAGAKVVVNVAPSTDAGKISKATYDAIDFLIVNQHELKDVYDAVMGLNYPALIGQASRDDPPDEMAKYVCKATKSAVVVTCGADGARLYRPLDSTEGSKGCGIFHVHAAELEDGEAIVDTVGAGDAFVGSFVASLAGGQPLVVCMMKASTAGTLACTKAGAQGGTPSADVVEKRSASVVVDECVDRAP